MKTAEFFKNSYTAVFLSMHVVYNDRGVITSKM